MRPYPPNHLAARDTDCFEAFLVMVVMVVVVDVNVVVMLGILVVVMMTA